jgi:hypothetical protein
MIYCIAITTTQSHLHFLVRCASPYYCYVIICWSLKLATTSADPLPEQTIPAEIIIHLPATEPEQITRVEALNVHPPLVFYFFLDHGGCRPHNVLDGSFSGGRQKHALQIVSLTV